MKPSHALARTLCACLLCVVCKNAEAAIIWSEMGDAGDTLATANATAGLGDLDAIVGTLPDQPADTNVDLFKIYISDLSLFSATTDNLNTNLFDSWLYLFDIDGKGVAASSSSANGSFNATISLGSLSGSAGLYYLAVTRFETVPVSGSGDIFPDLVDLPFDSPGEVVGPTGPGGGNSLAGWTLPVPDIRDLKNYRVDLMGAEFASPSAIVPEPTSAVIWLVVAILITALHFSHRLLSFRHISHRSTRLAKA